MALGWNRTLATLIGGASSHHGDIPAPLKHLKQDGDILLKKIKIFFLSYLGSGTLSPSSEVMCWICAGE